MKNIRVEYSAEATFNLGNFENVKPHYGMSADVDPENGETPDVVFEKIKNFVDGLIETDAAEIKR